MCNINRLVIIRYNLLKLVLAAGYIIKTSGSTVFALAIILFHTAGRFAITKNEFGLCQFATAEVKCNTNIQRKSER